MSYMVTHACKVIAATILALAIAGRVSLADAAASDPFFLYGSPQAKTLEEQGDIAAILRKHVTAADYIGDVLAHQLPDLASRVGRHHIFQAPANVDQVVRDSVACAPESAGLIFYDPEHYAQTPAAEQTDPVGAIRHALAAAQASRCHDFGVTPDGKFIGVRPTVCGYNLNASVFAHIDFTGVTLVNFQDQVLLGDKCQRKAVADAYLAFTKALTAMVRAKAPRALITAQIGLRDTPPDRAVAIIQALSGVVDGFYIAYPATMQITCKYCTPEDLDTVLSAFHHS